MSQYSTDFSGYTAGQQPLDWRKVWEETCNWTVENASSEPVDGSSFGDRVLKADPTVAAKNGLSWDSIGTPIDVDIKARVRLNTALSGGLGLIARAFTDSTGNNGYQLCIEPTIDKLILRKRVAGTSTNLASYDTEKQEGLCIDEDVWYCMRLQVSGESIIDLKGKIWRADADEPESWQIEKTNDSLTEGGQVGFTADHDAYFDWIGVGTEGSVPPDFPATEASARVTQAAVEVSRAGDVHARITQAVIEALRGDLPTEANARITQAIAEISRTGNSYARITQSVIEALRGDMGAEVKARITQAVIEILRENIGTEAGARITQAVIEALRGDMGTEARARITQVVAEVLREIAQEANARITQAAAEVSRTGDPRARITQAAIEVLRVSEIIQPVIKNPMM